MQQPTKKQFQAPELIVYGDIREVTQSANKTKGDDGSTSGNKKTE
jgi:hypothetical protein